jgi:hypothetical protein
MGGVMNGPRMAHAAFPRSAYPIHVEMIAERTGAVVYELHIEHAGVSRIPGLGETYGPISVRCSFADGMVVETTAAGKTHAYQRRT